MQRESTSFRNKFMLACALVAACVLATPAALAHGRHRGHGDDSAKVLGALVVGAVIGGVLVSASQHDDDYQRARPYPNRRYYPPAPVYRPSGYYGTYPSHTYGDRVHIGVVYSSGDRHRRSYEVRHRDRHHRGRGWDRDNHGHDGYRRHSRHGYYYDDDD